MWEELSKQNSPHQAYEDSYRPRVKNNQHHSRIGKKTTLCLTSEEIKTVLSKYTIVEKTWYRISNDGYEKANPCKGKKYWMSHSFISYVYRDILVNVVLF